MAKRSKPVFRVAIMEYERGWGSRLDETKEFRSLAAAKRFIKKFNAKNNKSTVPDWYMCARLFSDFYGG